MQPHLTGVTATVKWFNPTKGYGFVEPNDGSPDAFLHIGVLERSGYGAVEQGTQIVCDIGQGQRGPQVAAIQEVDTSTAVEAPDPGPRGPRPGPADRGPLNGASLEGTVKFFNAEKGFGFIIPDEGGKDIFVHIRALQRCGLEGLDAQQRVRFTTRDGQKGPEADRVELLD